MSSLKNYAVHMETSTSPMPGQGCKVYGTVLIACIYEQQMCAFFGRATPDIGHSTSVSVVSLEGPTQ